MDWRTDYLICEHVAKNSNIETRHNGFRVCCEACYEIQDSDGVPIMLYRDVIVDEKGGLSVMRRPPESA